MIVYKITRFFLYPIIFLADFVQTNFTKYFLLMNKGPIGNNPRYSKIIKKSFKKKDFILDYGCGVGIFSKLFNKKNYVGFEVNKNFIKHAKKLNKGYNFYIINQKNLKNYKKKINAILINNVLHHLSDKQVVDTIHFVKQNSKKRTKILIIEPLVENFFSIGFFIKALDIGNFIRRKKEYISLLKNIKIKRIQILKFEWGDSILISGIL